MRRRLGFWIVVAALAGGCASPEAAQPPADNRADVWFMQHMVPHLLQDISIAYLTRDRLTDPELVRLAGRIHGRGREHAAALQGWLAERGLAPHGHSHQAGGTLRPSDLERLSRLEGPALDLAFVRVMTARHRAGGEPAATEARVGELPEVRELARQLLAEQRAQLTELSVWRRACSKAPSCGSRAR